MPTVTKELGRIWASSVDSVTRDPGATKYSLGFVAEIPTYQVLNFLHQRIDQNILALAERGVFVWGNDVTYVLGAKVWDDFDGLVYQAKVASPLKTTPPSQNPTQWEPSIVNVPKSQFDKLQTDLTSHVNDLANPHKLSAGQLDTYTRAIIDSMAAKPQGDIDSHIANKNNPHEDTAAKIGAVPVSGGTYGGGVTHATGEVIIGNAGATTAVKTEAGNIFLRSGALEFGIDSAGKAYFKNAAGTSFMLDEDLFLEVKMREEKNYATPLPSTEFKFHTDLHTYAGVGLASFTGPGGKNYIDRSGASKVSEIDQPRITQLGMAFRDATEVLYVDRKYEGFGWTMGTMEVDFYVHDVTEVNSQFIMKDDGFVFASVKLTGSVLTFSWTNSAGIATEVELTNALTAGRHRFVVAANGTSGNIAFYLDGQLIRSTTVSLPDRTGWTKTWLMYQEVGSVPLSRDNYLVGFRLWPIVLTEKQVAGL